MIPITMSYFLNRESGGRRDAILQAVVFCLGIIVLFSGLGLIITAALGPVGVVQLGANPWVNGFIAALFIVFSLSLLGAFEFTIPSPILTRLNQASGSGGFAGTLLMGLTYSLASFACVGPFVGTLLAASVSGGGLRPLVGMVTFSTGMALPFFFLALFPAVLKKMPRSGGWLVRVKIVLGFVILAASLKYLSAVDQTLGWNWLTRERFLAAWIVLFAMAGSYLLGLLRLEGVKPDEPLGLGRLATGTAFLIFAVSLVPGMSGGKLGDLDAYVPAPADASAIGFTAATVMAQGSVQRSARSGPPRRQARLHQLHWRGLRQLPLDGSQYASPPRDRRRTRAIRAGGTLHRPRRRRQRGQREAGRNQVRHRGRTLLRHRAAGWKRGGDVRGPHHQCAGVPRVPEPGYGARARSRRPKRAAGEQTRRASPRSMAARSMAPAKCWCSISGPPGACRAFRRCRNSTACTASCRRKD